MRIKYALKNLKYALKTQKICTQNSVKYAFKPLKYAFIMSFLPFKVMQRGKQNSDKHIYIYINRNHNILELYSTIKRCLKPSVVIPHRFDLKKAFRALNERRPSVRFESSCSKLLHIRIQLVLYGFFALRHYMRSKWQHQSPSHFIHMW